MDELVDDIHFGNLVTVTISNVLDAPLDHLPDVLLTPVVVEPLRETKQERVVPCSFAKPLSQLIAVVR